MFASTARRLTESHLAARLARSWVHVAAVAKLADVVASRLDLDADVLVAAAWLHDIGYSQELADTGFHPLDGARYLRDVGVDPVIVGLVAHHSSAVVEARERGLDRELLTELSPCDPAMGDALWYCDMTTGPDGVRMTVEQRLDEIRSRYGPEDVVTRFVDRASADLIAAVRRVDERLAVVGAAQSR